jgi:cysteine desulfurase/selenocysteine lyase
MNVTSSISSLDVEKIRKDFPILSLTINGKPLVYLDNAATSQKPNTVIKAIEHYYTHQNSNIHRGVHFLSQRATEAYEVSRKKVAKFINAPHEPGSTQLRKTICKKR